MSKYQRTKGHSFERHVAAALRGVYPDSKRGYQTRGGTTEAPDVDGTPWFIECKVGARPNIMAAMQQARDATDGRPVLAVTKRDREEPLVTMELPTFLGMIECLKSDSQTR